MAWYMAKSLEVLRGQLNTLAPRRSTVSDGGIGDADHSARTSDHNPTAAGQVCARDFTHDPAGGLDCHGLARVLVASRDPRIKYVIWDRKILDTRPGFSPWQWKPYSGTNPHTKHLHLSVHSGAIGDQTGAWNLSAPAPTPEDDMPITDEDADKIAGRVWFNWAWSWNDGKNGMNPAQMLARLDAANAAEAAKVDALIATVATLSKDPGINVDTVRQIVTEAVQQNIRITGEVHIGAAQ